MHQSRRTTANTLPIILDSENSPAAMYSERALQFGGVAYWVMARVEDFSRRVKLMQDGLECINIP